MHANPQAEMLTDAEFAELVHLHQNDVWRYLRFLGARSDEADDLTQETFLALFQAKFEQHNRAQTASYLRKVARNRLLMARRKQGREPNTADLAAAEQVWANTTAHGGMDEYLTALADCLENGLQNSDGRARQALDAFYRNRQGRAEIAKQLDMTSAGVKTLLRRTRDVLRQCIERRINPTAT